MSSFTAREEAVLLEILESRLRSMEKSAADTQDRVALALLDAIHAIPGSLIKDEEKLALMHLLQLRLDGMGPIAGRAVLRALSTLLRLL